MTNQETTRRSVQVYKQFSCQESRVFVCIIEWFLSREARHYEIFASRAIDIWEDFFKLIKLFVAKVRSTQINNILCNNLKEQIPIYSSWSIYLLRNVAARLNCFLIKFQIEGPMVLFTVKKLVEICGGLWVSLFKKRC